MAKKILICSIIIILSIIGILTWNKLNISFKKTNSIIFEKVETEDIDKNNNGIENVNELKVNLTGTFRMPPAENDCVYVDYTFYDNGTMQYSSDFSVDGNYIIEDNKVKITYTVAYDPTNGLPRSDLEIPRPEELTIVDDNSLVNTSGIYFYLIYE